MLLQCGRAPARPRRANETGCPPRPSWYYHWRGNKRVLTGPRGVVLPRVAFAHLAYIPVAGDLPHCGLCDLIKQEVQRECEQEILPSLLRRRSSGGHLRTEPSEYFRNLSKSSFRRCPIIWSVSDPSWRPSPQSAHTITTSRAILYGAPAETKAPCLIWSASQDRHGPQSDTVSALHTV